MRTAFGQLINYVDAAGSVKPAKVIEDLGPDQNGDSVARVDFSAGTKDEPAGHHTAVAHYAAPDDKKPGTWHQRDAQPASASPAAVATPLKKPAAASA